MSILFASPAQEIEVYFSQPVDTALHIGVPPDGWNVRLDSLLAEYIDEANYSVDFCIYNIDETASEFLFPAIRAASGRGVRFRMVFDYGMDYSDFLDLLDSLGINYVFGPPSHKMHIKMFLIDARDSDTTNDIVIVSSSNLTVNNLLRDANNTVIFHWHSLAREMLGQFNIYWGDTGDIPNPDRADFSDLYPDTINHIIYGEDATVEVYFSPQKNYNEERIYQVLSSANFEMYFAINIFYYSATNFVSIMQNFFYNGGDLRGVFGGLQATQRYSVYLGMLGLADEDSLNWEIHPPVVVDSLATRGDLHSKYLIGDGRHPESDPFVLTGSMNWAASGLYYNNECVVIIHNFEVAQKFLAEFATRYAEGGGDTLASIRSARITSFPPFTVFPNPSTGKLFVSPAQNVEIYDILGRFMGTFSPPVDLSSFPEGTYLIKTPSGTKRIVVSK